MIFFPITHTLGGTVLIFCMTSNYEGFPMVLLEAMQFGCVPIAFKSFESLDDIIINHNNGYQITPFDIYEYINSLSDE